MIVDDEPVRVRHRRMVMIVRLGTVRVTMIVIIVGTVTVKGGMTQRLVGRGECVGVSRRRP